MMASLPRITVVTPSFNQGRYIERTIDSVLSQQYPNLEYIVIDGGSTDESVDVIRRYQKHLTYWVSEEDNGQSHAINKGFNRSTGKLLTWLNSDDRLMPGALATLADAFGTAPSSDLVVGVGQMVDLRDRVIETYAPAAQITKENLLLWFSGTWFLQPACMFSRAVWERCGPLDEAQHFVFDIDFFLKACSAGFMFRSIERVVAQALRHEDAKTTAHSWQTMLDGAILMEKHGATNAISQQCARMVKELNSVNAQLKWYRDNYRAASSHPLVRAIQPIAKLFARSESQYWRNHPPPWMP